MKQPSEAYFAMRSAYARWFWSIPVAALMGFAAAILAKGSQPGRGGEIRRATAIVIGGAVIVTLMVSVTSWRAYQSNRAAFRDEWRLQDLPGESA